MATYQTLRDSALTRLELTGNPAAQAIAEDAIAEAMKFITFHVPIPSLIASATFTVVASSPELESNAIPLGVSGFNVAADYQCPYRLFVKSSSSANYYGNEYTNYLYHQFISLLSIPSCDFTITAENNPVNGYELANRPYTITPDNKVWILNINTGNVVTLFYKKNPAAYNNGNTPEILPKYDYILVSAAEIALKEWLRESPTITHTWELFNKYLIPEINKYMMDMTSQKKPLELKLHRSYRV